MENNLHRNDCTSQIKPIKTAVDIVSWCQAIKALIYRTQNSISCFWDYAVALTPAQEDSANFFIDSYLHKEASAINVEVEHHAMTGAVLINHPRAALHERLHTLVRCRANSIIVVIMATTVGIMSTPTLDLIPTDTATSARDAMEAIRAFWEILPAMRHRLFLCNFKKSSTTRPSPATQSSASLTTCKRLPSSKAKPSRRNGLSHVFLL